MTTYLPEYVREHGQPAIGTKVYVENRYNAQLHVVTAVSKTGQVTVAPVVRDLATPPETLRFTNRGKQTGEGCAYFGSSWLNFDVEGRDARVAREQAEREARGYLTLAGVAVPSRVGKAWMLEKIAEAEKAVAAARAAIEAIPE